MKAKPGKNVSAELEKAAPEFLQETIKPAQPSSTRVTFYLPTELHQQLKIAAENEQRPMSTLCANALRAYLKEHHEVA